MIEVVLAAALAGQEPGPPGDCAQAMTTFEVNACAMADLEAETARMELYLEAARARAGEMDQSPDFAQPTDQVRYLAEAQAAWEVYASAVCDGVYDQWKEGTIRTVMAIDCRIRLTRERTHAIWRHHLSYVDSTPPVLPEPVEPVGATR